MAEYRAIEGAVGEEDIAITATVKTLTVPTTFSDTIVSGRAKIQVRTAPIRYTLNGVPPNTMIVSSGQTLNVNDTLVITGSELAALRMVRATATDADAHVRYERRIN